MWHSPSSSTVAWVGTATALLKLACCFANRHHATPPDGHERQCVKGREGTSQLSPGPWREGSGDCPRTSKWQVVLSRKELPAGIAEPLRIAPVTLSGEFLARWTRAQYAGHRVKIAEAVLAEGVCHVC